MLPTITILRFALLGSVLLYPVVAMVVLGAPDWARPWVPTAPELASLFWALGIAALCSWGASLVVGQLTRPRAGEAPGSSPLAGLPAITRFVLSAAIAESGALMGLVAGFMLADSRLPLLAALPSALLVLLAPGGWASAGSARCRR